MKYTLLLILLTGCASLEGTTTASLGVGHHFVTILDDIKVNRREALQIEVKHKLDDNCLYGKYTHVSNPLIWPLKEKEGEFASDSLYIGCEIDLSRFFFNRPE